MDDGGLRRRKVLDKFAEPSSSSDTFQKITKLDVFPKIPSDFKKSTNCGVFLTILCSGFIIFMIIAEFVHYRSHGLEFSYSVDKDFSSRLPLAVDITIAMPCETIGADIVDLVNENIDIDGGLNEEPTYFELTPDDEKEFQHRRHLNTYITEEYHALHRLLWSTGYRSSSAVPHAKKLVWRGNIPPDACRIFGLVHVNKMAGNFHVLSGKALHGADIHAHISLFVAESATNFSHRIDRLGFGLSDYSIVNPLDAELKITDKHSISYQYNLKVVPTEVQMRSASVMTYQYGVQATERSLNHSTGSHGIPGIFIKYDINPLKIIVSEKPVPIVHFLIRVCGVVGGIFATTGIVSSLVNILTQRVFGRQADKKLPVYQKSHESVRKSPVSPAAPPNALFAHLTLTDGHTGPR